MDSKGKSRGPARLGTSVCDAACMPQSSSTCGQLIDTTGAKHSGSYLDAGQKKQIAVFASSIWPISKETNLGSRTQCCAPVLLGPLVCCQARWL